MKKVFKFFKWVIILAVCALLFYVVVRFGPLLYDLLTGGGNTRWISVRISEELKEMNELIVHEATLENQGIGTVEDWLLGTVLEYTVPYTYDIRFAVNLDQCQISVDGNTIKIQLPPPKAVYGKLTVDESGLKITKGGWPYKLTPEQYASFKEKLEAEMYEETSTNQEYLDAAWDTAVKNMEGLFRTVAEQSILGATCEVKVIMTDPNANGVVENPSPTAEPALDEAA